MKPIASMLFVITAALLLTSPAQAGYADGMNQYAGYHVMHGRVDPSGMKGGAATAPMPVQGITPPPIFQPTPPQSIATPGRHVGWHNDQPLYDPYTIQAAEDRRTLDRRKKNGGRKEVITTQGGPSYAPAEQFEPYDTNTKCPNPRRKNKKGCLIGPAPAMGGHAHHDNFVRQLQGHDNGVFVQTPDGEMAIYDGSQRKGQVFEAKTGYEWLNKFHPSVIDALAGGGLQVEFVEGLDWMRQATESSIEQHARQVSVARKCNLQLDWYIDNKTGQKGFRRIGIHAKYVPYNPFDSNIPPFDPLGF